MNEILVTYSSDMNNLLNEYTEDQCNYRILLIECEILPLICDNFIEESVLQHSKFQKIVNKTALFITNVIKATVAAIAKLMQRISRHFTISAMRKRFSSDKEYADENIKTINYDELSKAAETYTNRILSLSQSYKTEKPEVLKSKIASEKRKYDNEVKLIISKKYSARRAKVFTSIVNIMDGINTKISSLKNNQVNKDATDVTLESYNDTDTSANDSSIGENLGAIASGIHECLKDLFGIMKNTVNDYDRIQSSHNEDDDWYSRIYSH